VGSEDGKEVGSAEGVEVGSNETVGSGVGAGVGNSDGLRVFATTLTLLAIYSSFEIQAEKSQAQYNYKNQDHP
jgi:hypothetical protein